MWKRPYVIYQGDVRETLRAVADDSVHAVITSPPYFQLRDYHGNEKQVGLERTPEAYVEALATIFDEVRRVLRPDGTLWMVMGDTYAAGGKGGGGSFMQSRMFHAWDRKAGIKGYRQPPAGLKEKDLMGIPWRLAFALQARGWYLRSDIIWEKGNAAPEAVHDRPTRSHEYVFLLSKSRRYFYDRDAISVAVTGRAKHRTKLNSPKGVESGFGVKANAGFQNSTSRYLVERKNKRSVWKVNTAKSRHSTHYATFPLSLILPMIRAATSWRGVCPTCGAPYVRQVERYRLVDGVPKEKVTSNRDKSAVIAEVSTERITTGIRTTGWSASCKHEGTPIPATVFDPFTGSGTTLAAAVMEGRRALGCELNLTDVEYALKWLASITTDRFQRSLFEAAP